MICNSKLTWFILLLIFTFYCIAQKKEIPDTGRASFYHDRFEGQETSNGEDYDNSDFTAAHRTLPFNSIVSVTNKQNGKKVIVRINDRGPFVKSRIIDLTHSAAQKLSMVKYGIIPVNIRVLTYLDRYSLSDSLFHNGSVWDSYCRESALGKNNIFVWQTRFVKHAFYIAFSVNLDYHQETVIVRALGNGNQRKYQVIIASSGDKPKCDSLLRVLAKDGYVSARMLKN